MKLLNSDIIILFALTMKPNTSKLNLVLRLKKSELLQDQIPTAKEIQIPRESCIL